MHDKPAATPRIEIRHIAECPHWEALVPLVCRALETNGVTGVEISQTLLTTEAEAEQLDFAGSPSIIVDGRDLFPSDGFPGGLACRVYETPAGLAGMPTFDQIVTALRPSSHACDCCGRPMDRSKLHAIGTPSSFICRRCGLWVFLRRGHDGDV